MKEIKKGDTVRVKDQDGGTTPAKVLFVDGDRLEVKWLEARWNLVQNCMTNRRGTKSFVYASMCV